MRIAGAVALCVAALVAACDPNDRNYFRGGIGTELYTADAGAVAELQNVYLDNLCRQSISYIGAGVPNCSERVPDNLWPLIVQAGLNDIDQRCDSYLSWLDVKKRENGAILSEIGAVRVAVDALTNPALATGISPLGLAGVAAAFGLATSTLGNINSLLLQVDHTTVQYVVFSNRRTFRESLLRLSPSINNKPAAIHSLRTYLNICMPMTIAANINATVTVFQQAAPGETVRINPLISTSTIGTPFQPRDRFGPRSPPGSDPDLPTIPGANAIIDGYPGNARTYTRDVIRTMLSAICAPDSEINRITPVTKSLFEIWEQTDLQNASVDGKIDARERKVLLALTPCPRDKVMNAFERQTYVNASTGAMKSTKTLITLLDRAPPAATSFLPGGGIFNRTATLQETRPRIEQLRRDCFKSLKKLPAGMAMQVTRDFLEALQEYSDKRDETPATSAPPPC